MPLVKRPSAERQARRQTVRSVNTYMVTAYWLIGWRIVEAEQGGETRAGYGERLMEGLSVRLTKRFGRGFSVQRLWNFRELFLTYRDRVPRILSTAWRESEGGPFNAAILSTAWREFTWPDETAEIRYTACSEPALRDRTTAWGGMGSTLEEARRNASG